MESLQERGKKGKQIEGTFYSNSLRTLAETTPAFIMHLAWMASPRKATGVNANRDSQAAIVRKVRITRGEIIDRRPAVDDMKHWEESWGDSTHGKNLFSNLILSLSQKTWMSAAKTSTTALQRPLAKTLRARSSASAMMVTKVTKNPAPVSNFCCMFVLIWHDLFFQSRMDTGLYKRVDFVDVVSVQFLSLQTTKIQLSLILVQPSLSLSLRSSYNEYVGTIMSLV